MDFNPDGSLKIDTKQQKDNLEMLQEETSELAVLRLLEELPFPVGKKLVADILRGEEDSRIRKLRLNLCEHHGALDLYSNRDIYETLDGMIFDGLVEITKTRSSKYYPVVTTTEKGRAFLENPWEMTGFEKDKERFEYDHITDKDKELFGHLGKFLKGLSEEQCKGIVCDSKNILCIAGAGSGKTTVLTRRIEFLARLKGIEPRSILAITFTRKARQEMIYRLEGLPVNVETFNSFCEKFLKRNEEKIIGRRYKVMDFKEKIRIFSKALDKLNYKPEMAIDKYYDSRKGKDEKTLFFGMMGDIFGLMDHYKNNMRDIELFKEAIINKAGAKDRPVALFAYNLIKKIEELKKKEGFRDYTDQIVDSIHMMKARKDMIPNFSHILVDEYQDVNDIQVKLLELLDPNNLFVVGDPRQSIYGWRGSKVRNIMEFPEKREESSVIKLTNNYRSAPEIVKGANKAISSMRMSDLTSTKESNATMTLMKHKDEKSEILFITQAILAKGKEEYGNIFVLARTNKQVQEITESLAQYGIPHIAKKSEEQSERLEPEEGKVTVSTVHAIKGLEARIVFIAGVNTKMFPCLVSEHPVQDLARIDFEYEKQEEELRLLYVAMTRAKDELHINFSGRLSKFINKDLQECFKYIDTTRESIRRTNNSQKVLDLKEWRREKAQESRLLPYMILTDKTLIELVNRMPRSTHDLHDVPGIGPTKIARYGEEILDILTGL
ncbi:MAG: UvrD-helicase domain-containing protein [Candidatus Woesearchaeota archaeon]